ncbi:hypothetical protein ACHAXR_000502 [Thalassiosira sp. AJA248-18]
MDYKFNSVYGPNQMRCLALVSHNGMKPTMMKFVRANKNVLKKFRLTGTNSTMTMLKNEFKGDGTVVFGPQCKSGPLGGDSQLVAMLCDERLGGVIFFQDPLDSHPHSGDIESLLRGIKIYNIMHASTTTSATMMMHTLRCGLEGGTPELLPSFFTTLECPSVERYKIEQSQVIANSVASLSVIKNRVAWLSDKTKQLEIADAYADEDTSTDANGDSSTEANGDSSTEANGDSSIEANEDPSSYASFLEVLNGP